MINTILITGGGGFIGSNLIQEFLKDRKYRLIILEKKDFNKDKIENYLDGIEIFYIEEQDLENLFKKNEIDLIIHLATYYKKYHNYNDIDPLIDNNIKIPTKLLDLAVNNGVKYFINTGTYFEYSHNYFPIRENNEYLPFNLYSSTKYCFENILLFYNKIYNLKVFTFKLFYPYGPNDNPNKLIPYIIINALKGNKIKLTKGFQKIDFIYVKDIVNAYLILTKKIEELTIQNEVFNVGTGKMFSIREIVSIIEEIMNKRIDIEWSKEDKTPDYEISLCDNSKIKNILGWNIEYNIYDGLKETINFYKNKY